MSCEGVLLLNKPKGKTSFWLVAVLRRILKVKKIGHAGTLDPMATGVMVMLIGSTYTRQSDQFLSNDKEYIAKIQLGATTDSYDAEGQVTGSSEIVPSSAQVQEVVSTFQGVIEQIPPMFSAKKVKGKKLYELARKGIEVERPPQKVSVEITILAYSYPYLSIQVKCSKGTYIRSLAHDIGQKLQCGGHLVELTRTKSGKFSIEECLNGDILTLPIEEAHAQVMQKLKK